MHRCVWWPLKFVVMGHNFGAFVTRAVNINIHLFFFSVLQITIQIPNDSFYFLRILIKELWLKEFAVFFHVLSVLGRDDRE